MLDFYKIVDYNKVNLQICRKIERSGKTMTKNEEKQMECIKRLVQDILSDESVTAISFQNRHGSISVSRERVQTDFVSAIGFHMDEDEEDGEEYEDE